MNFLELYDELNDLNTKIVHLQSRIYCMEEVSLENRDKYSVKLYEARMKIEEVIKEISKEAEKEL